MESKILIILSNNWPISILVDDTSEPPVEEADGPSEMPVKEADNPSVGESALGLLYLLYLDDENLDESPLGLTILAHQKVPA